MRERYGGSRDNPSRDAAASEALQAELTCGEGGEA